MMNNKRKRYLDVSYELLEGGLGGIIIIISGNTQILLTDGSFNNNLTLLNNEMLILK